MRSIIPALALSTASAAGANVKGLQLRVRHILLQSPNFITVLSLRLITQKILIFLTSAIAKREVWRAKQMSETRGFRDVGRQVCVPVAANHVPTLLAALRCSAAHHSCVDRKERKDQKCCVGQVTWGSVFNEKTKKTPKKTKNTFSISQLFWNNFCIQLVKTHARIISWLFLYPSVQFFHF